MEAAVFCSWSCCQGLLVIQSQETSPITFKNRTKLKTFLFETGNRFVMKFCFGIKVPDIITHANFGDHRFREFWDFSIELRCRPQNTARVTLALPCQRAITCAQALLSEAGVLAVYVGSCFCMYVCPRAKSCPWRLLVVPALAVNMSRLQFTGFPL